VTRLKRVTSRPLARDVTLRPALANGAP